jgi:hypothetical protein
MQILLMTISEKFGAIRKACDKHLVCEVRLLNEPAVRIVQPLGVCLTKKRGLVVVCWQIGGYASTLMPGSCNFALDDCAEIKPIEKTFKIPMYADDPEYCQDWLVHVEPNRLTS